MTSSAPLSCVVTVLPQQPNLQDAARQLDMLQDEHRSLKQQADQAARLRAQNAQYANDVANLPELKKAAIELQQQVVQLQHVRQQIQRLQVCGKLTGRMSEGCPGC